MGFQGTVTPASKEKLEREIAELEASGANPRKLEALKAVLKDHYGD